MKQKHLLDYACDFTLKNYTYISIRGLAQYPAIGLELEEFIKFHANIFYGKLQQVPESGKVLC